MAVANVFFVFFIAAEVSQDLKHQLLGNLEALQEAVSIAAHDML